MKREEVIKELLEHDIDQISQDHPERFVAEVLENGCVGYNKRTKKELEYFYNDTFRDNEGDEPIIIEEG